MRFENRVVVITGGGSGIGRVMAGRFAAEGARVVIADVLEERAVEAAAEIEAEGGERSRCGRTSLRRPTSTGW